MKSKGIPRIAGGAQAAEPKFAQFMGKLLPYINSGRGSLPARGTFDQNVARMTAWVQYMHKFAK
jgi:cytochrome c5